MTDRNAPRPSAWELFCGSEGTQGAVVVMFIALLVTVAVTTYQVVKLTHSVPTEATQKCPGT